MEPSVRFWLYNVSLPRSELLVPGRSTNISHLVERKKTGNFQTTDKVKVIQIHGDTVFSDGVFSDFNQLPHLG
jgi:hypothetical protein